MTAVLGMHGLCTAVAGYLQRSIMHVAHLQLVALRLGDLATS
jgi:hypothetical protein